MGLSPSPASPHMADASHGGASAPTATASAAAVAASVAHQALGSRDAIAAAHAVARFVASCCGAVEGLDLLVAHAGHPQAVLHTAAYVGNVDAVKILLLARASVDVSTAEGNTPLLKAIVKNFGAERPAVIGLLLRKQASTAACAADH